MKGQATDCIYPITLRNAPGELTRLLQDSGLSVHEAGSNENSNAIEITGDHSDDANVHSGSAKILKINARELLPAGMSWAMLEMEMATPVPVAWREAVVWLSESIIRETIANQVLMKLRRMILEKGLPWVCLAPYPAGYSGVFNFRVDLDEPEPADWRRVLDALEPEEPAVTWFLSTQAAERETCIYGWLAGRDVQSHGHWHHVHRNDAGLNQRNLNLADQRLRNFGFAPTGFASPCGRMTADLPAHLGQMQYQYLAGIGDLCGHTPRRAASGLWRVNALPVSEGLYLEQNIHDTQRVVEGYMQAAERALSHDRPVFWYGHAERRLGRKPEILEQLIRAIQTRTRLWHVRLGQYVQWLEGRRKVQWRVFRNQDTPDHLQLQFSHIPQADAPLVLVESPSRRWSVAASPTTEIKLSPAQGQSLPIAAEQPEFHLKKPPTGLKHWLRESLDWERETPVAMLRGGPMSRRAKGYFRAKTDSAWRARFMPKAWLHETEADKAGVG